ncbi:TIGR00730 family Rossman fold protein [uncultured Cyclobacterium sp.]|uniref:LOG family protein n=1 Tax=uncultured Cyclobacterium sp. TaxID=453820 RepID=UPI0030ED1337
MFPLKNITVYCGSNTGILQEYSDQAKALAKEMVRRELGLVYGAGKVGLMGIIADEMLASKSPVYGIIPQKLVDIEVAHQGCTDLVVVETMRDRKWLMAEKGDGFIAMPGGIGTLEELFEVMTLNQLMYLQKPLALYNVSGYYDKLLDFLTHVGEQGFLKPDQLSNLIVADDPVDLLDKMEAYKPTEIPDWLQKKKQ